jgi:hypothetical protein
MLGGGGWRAPASNGVMKPPMVFSRREFFARHLINKPLESSRLSIDDVAIMMRAFDFLIRQGVAR